MTLFTKEQLPLTLVTDYGKTPYKSQTMVRIDSNGRLLVMVTYCKN